MVTANLGLFVDGIREALHVIAGQRGGAQPFPLEGCGTTGIATNIPPTQQSQAR